jgi:hypothetical protein
VKWRSSAWIGLALLGTRALGGCGDSDEGGSGAGGTSQSGGAAGQSSDAGGKGGSSAGGTSGAAGTGASTTGGTSGAGGAGNCDALRRDLEAKLEQAAQCYAGAPNPSACDIMQDGLCNCAAMQLGNSSAYLQAAKDFKAAGCTLACPRIVCPERAVCQPNTPGSTQGRCVPASP